MFDCPWEGEFWHLGKILRASDGEYLLEPRTSCHILYDGGDATKSFESVKELRRSCAALISMSGMERQTNQSSLTSEMFRGGLGAGISFPEWIPRVSATALCPTHE